MQEPTDWIPQARSNLVENIKSLDDAEKIDALLGTTRETSPLDRF